VAAALLAHGADVLAEDARGRTPLHYAAEWGCEGIARALLGAGAWPDFQDAEDETPLHLACRGAGLRAGPSVPAVRALLGAGASPDLRNSRGLTAAGECALPPTGRGAQAEGEGAEATRLEALDLLLAAGAGAGDRVGGFGLLHLACGAGAAAAARALLDAGALGAGALLDQDNPARFSPLHCCAAAGHAGLVLELLGRGAPAGARDAEGETAGDLLQAAWERGVARGGPRECRAALSALRRAEGRGGGSGSSGGAGEGGPGRPLGEGPAGAGTDGGGDAGEGTTEQTTLRAGSRALAEALLDEPQRAAKWVARDPRLGQLLAAAKKAKFGIQLQHLLGAIHSNGAFQLGLAHDPAREALAEVLRDPGAAARHMGDDDDRVVDAVRTVRRLQEFCRSIGISSVRMADLEAGPGTEETDRKKSALLRRALDERLDAIAEACGGGAGEGPAGGVGAPAPASSPAEEAEPQGGSQAASPGEKRGRPGPSPSPGAAETATEEREKTSHWAKFKRELLRQLLIGALALAVTKLVMFMSPPGKSGPGQQELR